MATSTTPLSVYQLRIVLRGISPLIWRRVLVRSDMTLAHLHAMLQILFTWSDEHLHSFHIHGREYGSRGANASTCGSVTCGSIVASGSDTCTTLAPTGSAISVSKRSCPWHRDVSIRCV